MKCSDVRSSSRAESCHCELWHWQKAVLARREEFPEVTWCRNETVTTGQLTWATGSACPAYSCSDGADASHCTHFLSCFVALDPLVLSYMKFMVHVGSGAVFTCKSCSCNKSKEKKYCPNLMEDFEISS